MDLIHDKTISFGSEDDTDKEAVANWRFLKKVLPAEFGAFKEPGQLSEADY